MVIVVAIVVKNVCFRFQGGTIIIATLSDTVQILCTHPAIHESQENYTSVYIILVGQLPIELSLCRRILKI